MKSNETYKEIAFVFLKLGITGFGGPAAHIAMLQEEVVNKRKWISQNQFVDMLGATNLIPGPNSTEMTMHCGQERGGGLGMIIAGSCFILPAVIITSVIAYFYGLYSKLPEVEPFIYGIKAAIISIIASLIYSLGKNTITKKSHLVLAVATLILAFLGISEVFILFGLGILYATVKRIKSDSSDVRNLLMVSLSNVVFLNLKIEWKLFFIFLKMGSLLYGSGYVLFSFMDDELVKTNIISKQCLVDAIAVGQITPGPVFSSATFVGYQIAGISGAAFATVGIFLPSFLLVYYTKRLIPKLRSSIWTSYFLDTVNIVSICLIAVTCIEMGSEVLSDWRSLTIIFLVFLFSQKYRQVNSSFVVLASSVLGYVLLLI